MNGMMQWLRKLTSGVRVFALLALLLPGWQSGAAATNQPTSETGEDSVDISLITRDPDDGHLLTDGCYVLADFSEEGCDDNGDGQVEFADIPIGTYTVQQTQTPAGYPAVNDFEIVVQDQGDANVSPLSIPLGFVVKQAPEQNAPESRNVSVIMVDIDTHKKVVEDACVELIGASNMGCDEDLRDGQIDFLDVPAGGPYDLQFELPEGYRAVSGVDPNAVAVDGSEEASANQFEIVYLFAEDGSTSGTATLDITLRGCPEGKVPQTIDPAIECTVPLDAPPSAGAFWGGDGQGGLPMSDVERLYDGTYRVPAPANIPISLFNFEPSVRDDFMTVGASGVDGSGDPVVVLDPDTTGHVYIYYYFETDDSAPSVPTATTALAVPSDDTGTAEETWTASVQVMMCDSAPGAGIEPICHAEGGIVVDISLVSGTYLGSCTLSAPYPTPWGTNISTCDVPGMPFNQDIIATQDPATIPVGYSPVKETLSISVGNLIPGGGDQATFTFINVLANSGSTVPDEPERASGATLIITMRGCPEGFDPNTGDFWMECTIPLDAPDNAILIWGGDGQGGMNIAWMDRQYNGAYIYEAGPHTMNLQMTGLAPVVRDGYQVFGFDGVSGEHFNINLTNGETREVFVFYWFD